MTLRLEDFPGRVQGSSFDLNLPPDLFAPCLLPRLGVRAKRRMTSREPDPAP